MDWLGHFLESRSRVVVSIWTVASIFFVGCGGRQARIEVANYDPGQAAAKAVKDLDRNGDGILEKKELAEAPGLEAALESIDTNRDGKLDSAEIGARLQSYKDDGVGMLGLNCAVLMNGRPLEGATVDFIPEDFLEEYNSPARAVTRSDGSGVVTQTNSKLPAIAPGVYRVIISKKSGDKELVPAKYNANTRLGFEVTQQGGGAPAKFSLTSP